MKNRDIKIRFPFFLFILLLFFESPSVWAVDESQGPDNEIGSELGLHADALFDRARSTSSLRDYYRMRKDSPGLIHGLDFDFGIENISIDDYSVLTEFGLQDFSARVAFSFFRFDTPDRQGSKILHFRGIDLSGKSVVIGKSFVINEESYFDTYGRVFQEDLCVFLFSVYRVSVDLGFLRSRVMSDVDSTGVRSEKVSDGLERFFTPHESDEYAFYLNNTVFSGFDVNLIVGNLFKSISPRLDIPSVLRFAGLYPSGGIAPYIQKGALWGSFSENATSAGFEIEISNIQKTYQSILEPTSEDLNATVENKLLDFLFFVGFSLKAEHEFQHTEYSFIRSEGRIGFNNFFFFAASSFIRDPLLHPFGLVDDYLWGWRTSLSLYTPLYEISLSTALNFVDDIQFMTGSYNHPVTRIVLSVRF